LGFSGVGADFATGDVDNAGLGFLEVAYSVGVFAACEVEELGLGAHDGLVDFVGVRTAGDHEVGVIAAVFETALYISCGSIQFWVLGGSHFAMPLSSICRAFSATILLIRGFAVVTN
jgi:hypothetical protein